MKAGRTAAILLLPMLLASCGVLQRGFLNAAGPIAESQRHLFLTVGIVLLFVAGPVLLLTPLMAWHYRLSNRQSAYRPKWDFAWWLEALIWIPPSLIVVGLAVLLWKETVRLDPYRPVSGAGAPLQVQAVALDWKWLFIYPEDGIATVNQLVVPAGRAVHLSLTSGTVMQSLLVPRLVGQIYAMAGMTTQLNFAASDPGGYLGENTQYNGNGFQQQKFEVTALPQSNFDAWLAQAQKTGRPFDQAAYEDLFKQSAPAKPILYANAPAGLFQEILDRDRSGTPSERSQKALGQ